VPLIALFIVLAIVSAIGCALYTRAGFAAKDRLNPPLLPPRLMAVLAGGATFVSLLGLVVVPLRGWALNRAAQMPCAAKIAPFLGPTI